MDRHLPSQQKSYPAEVLLLIFEDLHCTAPDSLRDVRLVSRQFSVLVEPIIYRELTLNKALLECFEEDVETYGPPELAGARRRTRKAISLSTRHIIIDRQVDWSLVKNLLLSLGRFHHLSYFFGRDKVYRHYERFVRIPQSVLETLAEKWPSATFAVSVDKVAPSFAVKIPPANLTSLEVRPFHRHPLSQVERSLKTLLLRCGQLQELRLLALHSGTHFLDEEIEEHQRLPAVEALHLEGYFWQHSSKIATSFWDWSRLTSLRLEKVFIINFLESVPPEDLLQLKSLITDGHCQSAVDYSKATDLMTKLVRAVKSLHTLSLSCSIETFPMDVIRKHDLRTLSLRDYEGMTHRPLRQSPVPTFSLFALLDINSFCPNIMELALDLDQGMMSSSFVNLLLESRNLRRLTMFVQQPFLSGVDLDNRKDAHPHTSKDHPHTCLNRSCQAVESIEVGAASNIVDWTYEAVCTFFQDLLIRKKGAVFEKLTMYIAGNCNTIYADALSVEGRRQQLAGDSHKRTFVYENRNMDTRLAAIFERQMVQEKTAKGIGRPFRGLAAWQRDP